MSFTIGGEIGSSTFIPVADRLYKATIRAGTDNERDGSLDPSKLVNFKFNVTPENASFIFRLYIQITEEKPSGIKFQDNVIWNENIVPDFSMLESMYMLEFEYNPFLNKWVGKMVSQPILNSKNSGGNSAFAYPSTVVNQAELTANLSNANNPADWNDPLTFVANKDNSKIKVVISR